MSSRLNLFTRQCRIGERLSLRQLWLLSASSWVGPLEWSLENESGVLSCQTRDTTRSRSAVVKSAPRDLPPTARPSCTAPPGRAIQSRCSAHDPVRRNRSLLYCSTLSFCHLHLPS